MSELRESQQQKIEQPPLIVAAKRQSGFQRYGFRLITVLFWVVLLLLFRVAVTPLAWLVGAQSVYEMFSYKVDTQDFLELMMVYALVVVAIGVCLIGWARYNQYRFRKNERRTEHRPPASVAEVADFYQLSTELVVKSAHARRLSLQHAEDGQLRDVAAGDLLPPLAAEPIPTGLNRYLYHDYLLQRDDGLRWSVYLTGKQLYFGSSFDSCRDYIDSLLR